MKLIKGVWFIFLSCMLFAGNPIPLDINQIHRHFNIISEKEEKELNKKLLPTFTAVSKILDKVLVEQGHVTVKFRDKDYNKKTGKFSASFTQLMRRLYSHFTSLGCDTQAVIFDGDEEGTFGLSAKSQKSNLINI